ncbi:MAG: bifunctional (p)ppGpp synthetase/guanosine-3',5'-bis(diphosphate) 3'-pyrophosphohydrolase [Bacteroidales bacterium]|nr:bifunctional (p)ppGpp synthetase/guanosine-3',5'-bis(diphosphate) 3'-pyrophosphohydrolase [Bacteroidales bacterium]
MSLQDIYQETIKFAAKAHRGQKVPGSRMPYLLHLSNVCMEIIMVLDHENSLDKELAVRCALLHDCIEDTRVGFNDIEKAFGKGIADGVLALSKNKKMKKEEQVPDSLQRIMQQPKEIWMVKLADRITNLQQPPDFWSKEKIRNYHKESMLIYEKLKESNKALAERMKGKIEEYRKYFE